MATAPITVEASNMLGVASAMEQVFTPTLFERFPLKFVISFSDIKFDRTVFTLNRPLELTLAEVDGGWTCEEPTLSLFSFGESDVRAVCSLFEDFAVLWEEIAQAEDNTLSEDAIHLKQDLLSLVQSVK